MGPLVDPYSATIIVTNTIHSVVPRAITSAYYPNLLLSPDPYALPRTSPSGPYLLPYFIPDTIPPPSKLSSVPPSKELYKYTIYYLY